MNFEWDPSKSLSNVRKHGVCFEDAIQAFYDPWAFYLQDENHSATERREKIVGDCLPGVVVVIFTERRDNVFRIISARRANQREQIEYAKRRDI